MQAGSEQESVFVCDSGAPRNRQGPESWKSTKPINHRITWGPMADAFLLDTHPETGGLLIHNKQAAAPPAGRPHFQWPEPASKILDPRPPSASRAEENVSRWAQIWETHTSYQLPFKAEPYKHSRTGFTRES